MSNITVSNTRDLTKFGVQELETAVRLLTAFVKNRPDWLGTGWDGVAVEFNTHSGYVFLLDSNDNVGMLHGKTPYGDLLEQWFSCLECGAEGFREDLISEEGDNDCNGFLHAPDVEEEAS